MHEERKINNRKKCDAEGVQELKWGCRITKKWKWA